eukprot:968255-Prymnesium_polylepis.1
MLCSKGAAVNQAMDDGETPLYIACRQGHTEVAALCAARGGAAINQAADKGATPLHIAGDEGHTERGGGDAVQQGRRDQPGNGRW